MQQTADRLGRATFHHIAPQPGVRPTDRELLWLKHIERHGPQSSQYLYELTRDTHRCKDTALRQMQRLRAGGFLTLPPQQRQTAKAGFNPYIYYLTRKARGHLHDRGLAEPTILPQGHWWHSYMTACVTSGIDMAAARHNIRYIPAHEILAIKEASLAIPIGRQRLIPDQLFALNYGGSFRAFALEVDRGTEPRRSAAARKSLQTSINQYAELLDRQLYKPHYGLKANLLVLWVFTSRTRMEGFLEIVATGSDALVKSTLCQVVSEPEILRRPYDTLFAASWLRAHAPEVCIGTA